MALITVGYGRASDNVAGLATITASAVDSEYIAARLVDLDPGYPAKLTTTTGNFGFDWGSAQRQDHVAIIMHNLTPGISGVSWQMNASDSWGAPTVNAALTVPTDWEDGYPVSFHKDLTGVAGYSTGGFRYSRLNFGSANASEIEIGEVVVLSGLRTLSIVRPNVSESDRRQIVEHRTDYEVSTIYDRGVPVRTFTGELLNKGTSDTIRSWWRDVRGRSLPFLFLPNTAVNDAWFVRFKEPIKTLQYLPGDGTLTTCEIALEEVGKGLYL